MPAPTTIGQRFTQLIQHLGLSKNAFAISLDKTATVVQHLVEERNKPGYDLLCKVFEVYPNVSKDWLLLGQGEMLVSAATPAMLTAPPAPAPAMEPIDLAELTAPLRRPRPTGTHLQPADIAATVALAAAPPNRPTPPPSVVEVAPSPAASQVVPLPEPVAVTPPAPMPVPVAGPAPLPQLTPDGNYLAVLLHTQQLQHQLALAEQRNQHLLAQQALMQQLVDVLRAV